MKFYREILLKIYSYEILKIGSKFAARKISILEFYERFRGIAAAPGAVRKI